jgi:hypothetical protein
MDADPCREILGLFFLLMRRFILPWMRSLIHAPQATVKILKFCLSTAPYSFEEHSQMWPAVNKPCW